MDAPADPVPAGTAAQAERTLWHLTRTAERLCATVSPSRQRQIRWVVGELTTYHDKVPAPSLTGATGGTGLAGLAGLFDTGYLHGYLAAADAGALRRRGATNRPSPAGAARIRRRVLEMLAAAAHLPAPHLDPVAPPPPRAKVTPVAAERAMRILLAEARTPGAPPGLVRAVLVAALVHHHDLRTGEIAALTTADLTPIGEVIQMTYRPAAPGVGPGEPTTLTLAPVVAEMHDRWRTHRDALIPVPRVHHLLVSVRGNHHHGVRRPAGLPLQPRGLMRAHERVIANLNQTLHDRHGHDPDHTPLPRTLGELRPAVLGLDPTRADSIAT